MRAATPRIVLPVRRAARPDLADTAMHALDDLLRAVPSDCEYEAAAFRLLHHLRIALDYWTTIRETKPLPPLPATLEERAAYGERFDRLRAWRDAERERAPEAFAGRPFFLCDYTLDAIARACPATESDLRDLPGCGGGTIGAYGRKLITVMHGLVVKEQNDDDDDDDDEFDV